MIVGQVHYKWRYDDAIQLLLKLGARMDARTAISKHKVKNISKLLETEAMTRDGGELEHLLYIAISAQNIEAVERLLKNGADPNARGGGLPPLINAVAWSNGDLRIVSALIDHGADVNATFEPAPGVPQVTPISRARHVGFMAAVDLLRNAGAKE